MASHYAVMTKEEEKLSRTDFREMRWNGEEEEVREIALRKNKSKQRAHSENMQRVFLGRALVTMEVSNFVALNFFMICVIIVL